MKTNLYNILGRNLDAENAGVWVALEHEGEVIKDVQFKLKSFASDAGDKYRDLYGKYEKSLGKESLGKAVADALIESGIVCDWKGITDEKGAALDFKANGAEVLGDPTYDAIVLFIIQKAQKFSTFRENAVEKASKN